MKNIMIIISFLMMNLLFANSIWILDDNPNVENQGDWTAETWVFSHLSQGNTPNHWSSPFYSNHTALAFIAQKEASDFRYNDGWRLLAAYMGDSRHEIEDGRQPFVVLYNRYTGIMRYIFRNHIGIQNVSALKGFCEVRTNSNTGIFSTFNSGGNYIYALDHRNNATRANRYSKVIYPYSHEWMFIDVHTAFDDRINQVLTNIFTFSTRALRIFDVDLDFEGRISSSHTSTKGNYDIAEGVLNFGSHLYEFYRLGGGFREQFERLPGQLRARGADNAFVNNLADNLTVILATAGSSPVQWLTVAYGVFSFFSGNSSRGGTTNLNISAKITGTVTERIIIGDHNVQQPGRPPGDNFGHRPFYNQPLGVVQLANSPHVDRKGWSRVACCHASWTCRHESFRLTTLPSDWRVNPASGLSNTPRDVKIALSFDVRRRYNHPSPDIFDFAAMDYLVRYQRIREGNYYRYRYYTEFIDYDSARNIAINTHSATIENFKVKIMAVFVYVNNPSREPFVFLANYKPTLGNFVNTSTPFAIQSIQHIERITTSQTKQNFTLNHRYIIDNGVTLTIKGNVNYNSNSTNNAHYGFEVRNGTLIFKNTDTDIGNGIILASGENSHIKVISTDNSKGITAGTGGRIIVNGARMTVDNSTV